jgi:hypothetical protein
MLNRITIVLTASLFVFIVCVGAPAASAKEKCSLQTIVGTYAVYEKGSSLIVDTTQQPYLFHWSAALAPFANVALITFKPNGAADGYYWIYIGAVPRVSNDPIPVQMKITEMKENCTGKLTYVANLPGGLSTTVEERFILFDDGREFRTVPTSIQNGIDNLAWLGTGHRISKSAKPVKFCGQHTASGTYLLSAENIVAGNPAMGVADSLFIRQDVSPTGDWMGTLYEKIGPVSVETAALGTFSVNPDCSFTATLKVPEFFSQTIFIKGVFFNQGKEFYALGLDDLNDPLELQNIKFSFAYGKRINDMRDHD